jgi:hypothetical protein
MHCMREHRRLEHGEVIQPTRIADLDELHVVGAAIGHEIEQILEAVG